jgi:glycosyltransferase involved in cell wall biosynthesis
MTLLSAIVSLPDSYSFECHIAGKGSLQKKVEHSALIDKRIRFHGFVKRGAKHELLRKIHVVIFPSECEESFALSILEAMSYGALAVVSDFGGQKEIIRPTKNGWLFKPGNSEELAKRLKFIIENPNLLASMSREAIQDTRKYSLSAMADAYEKVYASLVSPD